MQISRWTINKNYLFYCILGFLVLGMGVTLLINYSISRTSQAFVTNDVDELKPVNVGLLLGTRRAFEDGNLNGFFFNRIEAAAQLFQAGKVQYFIVSGDNSRKDYNEPEDMKMELVKRGIPEDRIFLDYAGFRTLDSVIRTREIFGQNEIIVISQKFHNQRAVYIARKNGIEAFGYNAEDINTFQSLKTRLREFLARDKMFLDFLFGIQPKFLGEKIKIPAL